MKFFPNYPNDNNKGQRQIWTAIKNALSNDEGVAYYRYPIYAKSSRGRSEPDFLIVHRKYGVWVLESKGCEIGNICAINGHDWAMRDWYVENMSPISQVEAQFYEVRKLVECDSVLKALRIPFEYRVVLPFISTVEWEHQGYGKHPSTTGVVWLDDDIAPSPFRQHLHTATNGYMPTLNDAQWERLLGVFRGVVSDVEPRQPIPNSPPDNKSRTIHAVESRLRALDSKQNRIAQEVPEGPQRLRGLAGSGKTVLFAKRIAQMHASYPGWEIAFVYWSRSLNQQIKALVEHSYKRLTGELPNWAKLHIWHAWGDKQLTGFYREVSAKWGSQLLSLEQAKQVANEGESGFAAACRILESHVAKKDAFLDAMIVDEGQDLPAAFYRVAYRALHEPKRLYWAYDEAQGVDTLIVPDAAQIFGRDQNGKPLVDLSGAYASGMQKAHNLNRCYRTPKIILSVAHAINMGLLRDGGPLQGVTRKEDWTALGYQVVEGDFSPSSVRLREKVVLDRPSSTSGHPVDMDDFEPKTNADSLLIIHVTHSSTDDANLICREIQKDLECGLRPEDIAVVCLSQDNQDLRVLDMIANQLGITGIKSLQLNNAHRDGFRIAGHVTLSGIRRAKGNEAYKIYALNMHLAGAPYVNTTEKEMVARNQAFVALTRTKLWCVALGRNGAIVSELLAAKAQGGRLVFPAFNQTSLKRSFEDPESSLDEFF